MKIKKYYSLDECSQEEELYNLLNEYQELEKIDYEVIEDPMYGDVIKIDDVNLSASDHKKLIEKFNSFDLIDFPDYEWDEEEDDDDEWEEEEDQYDDEDY